MKQLSKPFYISSFLAGSILPGIFAVIGEYLGEYLGEFGVLLLIAIGLLLFILPFFVILTLTDAMWSSIEDVYARMSPAKAVGLLFIPIFNIYWMYQVLVGFVEDYNNFVSRNEIETPLLEGGIFIAHFLLTLLSLLPYIGWIAALINLVVVSIMISKICDAVNAVNSALSERRKDIVK